MEFLCIQAVIIFESDGDDFDFRVIYYYLLVVPNFDLFIYMFVKVDLTVGRFVANHWIRVFNQIVGHSFLGLIS